MLLRKDFRFSPWAQVLLAVLSGAFIVLSVPTFDILFLAWIGFVPLMAACASPGTSNRRAFMLGWIMGIVTHMGGFYWLFSTMIRFGNLHPGLAFAIFIIFGLASGLAFGLVMLLFAMLLRRRVPAPLALALPLMLVESFFPHLFSWTVAMSHWRFPLAFQTAEIWGVIGVAGVLALVNGILFDRIAVDTGWFEETRRTRAMARIVVACVCCIFVYGGVRMTMIEAASESLPAARVGVVQPNISIEEKKTPTFAMKNLWLLQSLSANLEGRGAEIVIWPETAYPFRVPRDQTWDFDGMRKISRHNSIPVVTGAVSYGQGRFYNSTYLVTPDEKLVGPSDKNNLVLFGEYNPLYDMVPESVRIKYPKLMRRGMSPGREPVILEHGPFRLGVLNCLEDILGSYTAEVARSGANLLVNVTNDAWFGDTAEPYQHFALSVFRTVETRRVLVRSVNTGVSAVVDLKGSVLFMSRPFVQDLKVVEVRLSDMKTPFQATGNLMGWLSGVMVLLILLLRRKTNR